MSASRRNVDKPISAAPAKGQNVVLKTNVLYDATATVNVGVEFSVAPKWTMDISGNYNGWNFSDNRKWKHSPRKCRNARPGVRKTAPRLTKICQNCRQMVLYKLTDEDF